MNSAFASIAGGTHFSKKKHGASMQLFSGKAQNQSKLKLDLFSPEMNEIVVESATRSTGDDDEDSDGENTPAKDKSDGVQFEKQEEVNAFRNKLQIKVKGDDLLNPCPTFYSMDIQRDVKPVIIKNIELTDWKEPTPIQMQAIPCMLAGRDVLAAAPTGSGKTAAFVIPTLSKLGHPHANKSKTGGGIRALLLAPTRELAEQIYRESYRLIMGRKIKICLLKKNFAANAIAKQDKTAFNKYDLLVSTPLRLLTLVRAGAIDLSHLEIVVLDEADKLFEIDSYERKNKRSADDSDDDGDEDEAQQVLSSRKTKKQSTDDKKTTKKRSSKHSQNESEDEDDEEDDDDEHKMNAEEAGRIRTSFLAQVDEILAECTKRVQRALFSATIGLFVVELSNSFLSNPIQITIGKENAGASTIDQKLTFVGREDGKLLAIRQIVQAGLKPPVLLFVQSIDRAKELYRELIYDGINVDVMHAERTQLQREDIINRFRTGEIWVLICTDLMARGIDFKGVQMVINYDLPQSAVSYIHRIGRTGRAGKRGTAITFFTEEDLPRIRPIANVIKLSGCPVPDWMLAIKHLSTRNKKQLRQKAPVRRHIDTGIHVPTKKQQNDEQDGQGAGKGKKQKKRKNGGGGDAEKVHDNQKSSKKHRSK